MTPLVYQPKEAAAVLGMSRSTIYELIASGKLAARKIGAATTIRHVDPARQRSQRGSTGRRNAFDER